MRLCFVIPLGCTGRLPQEEEAIVEEVRNTLIAFFTCVYALLAFSIKLKVFHSFFTV